MGLDGRLVEKAARSARLGAALLHTTIARPAAPLKLNFCLTYWCQYRCKTCNIWQRKPTDELTTDEIVTFVRENPHDHLGRSHRRRDLPPAGHRRHPRRRRHRLAPPRAPALSDQRVPDRSHRAQRRADRRAWPRPDDRHRQPRRRRANERRDSRHQGRLQAPDRDVQGAAADSRRHDGVWRHAVGLQRRPLRGDVRRRAPASVRASPSTTCT